MITVWWSKHGLIHYAFLPLGQAITAQSYCDQIHKKYTKLGQMQPALVIRHGLLLLHDNAQPHVSRIVFQKLNELRIEARPHPHYTTDLSPTDYHLFKHLDSFLKERAFKNQGDVESAFLEFLESRFPDFIRME
uniref:Histone-lysine N-methyltransferase SETMAR n=1 Tax=Haemonchus contortus TaxID=6289 RepID=A0A7I5E988_HAECO